MKVASWVAVASPLSLSLSLSLSLCLGLICPPASRAGDDVAPCAAEVSTVPESAIVGEQVLVRIRVLRRADVRSVAWVQPLAFPNVRAEWLPGRAEDTRIRRNGFIYFVREEHRAVFPARPGRLTLPEFELRCGPAREAPRSVFAASVSLRVEAPPERDRPETFSGVVGVIQVGVAAEPQQIRLGESVRLSVLVRGAANLWDLDEPFSADAFGNAEIFRRRPELHTEAGERLYVRRTFQLDVVPHEAGLLRIPPLELSYYDPAARRYALARTEPLRIRVGPRPAEGFRAADDGAPTLARPGTPAAGGTPVAGRGTLFALLGLLVPAAALAGWGLRARRQRPWRRVAVHLEEARHAAMRRDRPAEAAALTHALCVALDTADPAALDADTPGAIAGRAQLRELERVRFSRDRERADLDAIEALIRELRAGVT